MAMSRTPKPDDMARVRTALAVAWNHFEWATGERAVDTAIYEINAAELQFHEVMNRETQAAKVPA